MALRICSYNIHKGFSQFNRRMVVHELRDRLRSLDADLVFLQEVQGLHLGHPGRHPDWPALPQHEFLAEGKVVNQIKVPEHEAELARIALDRMLAVS